MGIDQKAMLQAVYDTIFDSLTTPPTGIGGGQPILPRATSYLSLCKPGIPVDATQFANAWSPTNPHGTSAEFATENFSRLVDEEPLMSPVYTASGNSIESLYGEIVNANVSPPPPDPAGEAAYKKAYNLLFVDGTDYNDQGQQISVKVPSPFYVNYQNKKHAYENALLSYLTNFLQYDLSKPEDQRKWSVLSPVLQGPVDDAYDDLQTAAPGVILTALNTLGQYQQSSLANIFSQARQTYVQTRLGAVEATGGTTWHASQAFPGNWFAESAAANFTTVTMDSRRVRLSEDSHFSSWSGGASASFGLWSVGGSASHQSQSYDMSEDTSNLMVSIAFGRIEIRRPWMNPALFSLKGWSTAGRSPGGYSSGNPANDPGVFPLLPTSFIVARDIKISANWGHADLHTASQSTTASASVGWGPFSLSGSYSNSSSSRRFNSSFDGTTISCPGIQIVGWLSSVNPFCPPTGGPPAAPESAGRQSGSVARSNPYSRPYLAAEPAFDLASFGLLAAPTNGHASGNGHGLADSTGRVASQPARAPSPSRLESMFVGAEN